MSQPSYPQPEYPPPMPYGPPPTPPKKSRSGTFFIVAGSIVAIVVIACFAGGIALFSGGESTSSGDSGDDKSAAGNDDGEDKGNDDPAAEGEPEAAAMGEEVTDGSFAFTVNEVEDGVAEVGEEGIEERADGQYVIVDITVKNVGDEPAYFDETEHQLVDTQGKTYSSDDLAESSVEENFELLDEINPGNEATGKAIFDVPEGTELDVIMLSGDALSDGVPVKLS